MKLHALACALALGTLLTSSSLSAVEIIAHRGASYDAPENTLAAMKLAWEQKADQIEADIHLSKDGKIITLHDFTTKRIGGVDKKVVDQTFAELRRLDAGSWKGSQWKGEPYPTLDSILATIPRGKGIFIEIKCGPEILPELGRVMKASGKKPKQLSIITFRYDVAQQAKEQFPKHKVYFLHDNKPDPKTGQMPNLDDLIAKAKAANLDGLDLSYRWPIDRAFVKKVKAAGLELYTWTVDDPAVARAHAKAGVANITTNRPEFLRNELKKKD